MTRGKFVLLHGRRIFFKKVSFKKRWPFCRPPVLYLFYELSEPTARKRLINALIFKLFCPSSHHFAVFDSRNDHHRYKQQDDGWDTCERNPFTTIHSPHRPFNLSAIRYILGTRIRVMKNANVNPKMIVHDNGFQKAALSPPKNIFGLRSVNRVTKLILKPIAKGISARMAASAVSNTGMIRVLPACITASLVRTPLARNSSANSITRIPFLITIPASPRIPTPVITTDTCMPVIANPSNTPITLKTISVRMMTDLLTELNCTTRIEGS